MADDKMSKLQLLQVKQKHQILWSKSVVIITDVYVCICMCETNLRSVRNKKKQKKKQIFSKALVHSIGNKNPTER